MKKKTSSVLYPPSKVATARENIRKYKWAQAEAAAVIGRAEPWVQLSDDALWEIIPAHTLPRYIDVNPDQGCPKCGKANLRYGLFAWKSDPLAMPWKLQCPHCGEAFPKNDFGAYYRSGLDAAGVFRRERADAKLLFNPEHPDPADPLHRYGVDAGAGWEGYVFIPYYTHWAVWGRLFFTSGNGPNLPVVKDMARAYLFTGENKYAHKAGILLDRVADVYPAMDYIAQGDHGKWGKGGVFDLIWETFFLSDFADAYDAVFEGLAADKELPTYLAARAARGRLANPKTSFAHIQRNIEENVLRLGLEKIERGDVAGNATMDHETFVRIALVLDDDQRDQRLQHIIFGEDPGQPRGGPASKRHAGESAVLRLLDRHLQEDGSGYESIGYHKLFDSTRRLANLLAGDPRFDVYKLCPKFKKFFDFYVAAACIDRYYPNLGDSFPTGWPVLGNQEPLWRWSFLPLETYFDAFRQYRDPRFAKFINLLAHGKPDAIHGDIFAADNEEIAREINRIVAESSPPEPASVDLTGYGLAILRSGRGAHQRAAWLSYGAPGSHGHYDKLSIGLYAKGLDLLPDLGYPEHTGCGGVMADKLRHNWNAGTISHNTVIVNHQRQERCVKGVAGLYAAAPFIKAVVASDPEVYAVTSVYDRHLFLLDLDDNDSYLVDIFRVRGGQDHLYSFHAFGDEAVVENMPVGNTRRGTLAGAGVAFAGLDPALVVATTPLAGYDCLSDVRYGKPTTKWSVTWNIKDAWQASKCGARSELRLTMLCDLKEVAVACGNPPRNDPRVPQQLTYVLARRHSSNAWGAPAGLESCFVAVIEPYSGKRRIRNIERLACASESGELTRWEGVALKIERDDGGLDYVLDRSLPGHAITAEDITITGLAGYVAQDAQGRVRQAAVLEGRAVAVQGKEYIAEPERVKESAAVFSDGKTETYGMK